MGLTLLLGAGCADMSSAGGPMMMEPQAPRRMSSPEATVSGGQASVDGIRAVQSISMSMPGAMSDAPPEEKIAFHSADGDEMGPPPSPPPPPPQAPPPVSTPKPATTPPADPTPQAGEVSVIRGPLLVYTAQITVAVFEVNVSLGQVEAIGKELGGFLAKRDDISVTIRIPVARFEDAVKRIEKIGDMLHRNVTAEDVTEEFRASRGAPPRRPRGAGAADPAARQGEQGRGVGAHREELTRVSGEIHRVEGRMNFVIARPTRRSP